MPPTVSTPVTVPLDGSTLFGATGPFDFETVGEAVRVHLNTTVELYPDPSIVPRPLVELFYRIDGGEPVLCAVVGTYSPGSTDFRQLLCESIVPLPPGPHELAFEIRYVGRAPIWVHESASLVTVEEVALPRAGP